MSDPLLHIKDLSSSFQTKDGLTPILMELGYSVDRGEILGIVGESGSGKTLSAKTILGLFPDHGYHIHSGQILFLGSDLLKLNHKSMRHIRGNEITMVFQDSLSALNPYLNVKTQLLEAVKNTGLSKQERLSKAVETLKWVGFGDAEEKIYQYPFELSGGMRQRVLIAMALLPEPMLLIADEPTSSIDATLSKQILALFGKINQEKKISIIFISHNFSHVASISDRILVMYGGRAMEIGSTGAILSKTAHPYTKALLDSIPVAGSRITSLPFIPGEPPDLSKIGKDACPFYPRCKFMTDVCQSSFPLKTIIHKREVYCHHPLNPS